MEKITGNEQAFPVAETTNPGSMTPIIEATSRGLTIRQQFAMAAMQGLVSCHNDGIWTGAGDEEIELIMAKVAVRCADALINELNKEANNV